jgi:hypothetical protein
MTGEIMLRLERCLGEYPAQLFLEAGLVGTFPDCLYHPIVQLSHFYVCHDTWAGHGAPANKIART